MKNADYREEETGLIPLTQEQKDRVLTDLQLTMLAWRQGGDYSYAAMDDLLRVLFGDWDFDRR